MRGRMLSRLSYDDEEKGAKWREGEKERRRKGEKEKRREGEKERRREGEKERRREGEKERRREGEKEERTRKEDGCLNGWWTGELMTWMFRHRWMLRTYYMRVSENILAHNGSPCHGRLLNNGRRRAPSGQDVVRRGLLQTRVPMRLLARPNL